jgi:hypothetical protein
VVCDEGADAGPRGHAGIDQAAERVAVQFDGHLTIPQALSPRETQNQERRGWLAIAITRGRGGGAILGPS